MAIDPGETSNMQDPAGSKPEIQCSLVKRLAITPTAMAAMTGAPTRHLRPLTKLLLSQVNDVCMLS